MPEEDSNYQIIFSPQARRSLRKLPPNIQQRVVVQVGHRRDIYRQR